MAEESPVVLNGGLTWTKLTTLLLTVVIGTMGSNVAFRIAEPPRADPFTGKDGQLLEIQMRSELKDSILEIRREISDSERRKPPGATRTRILELESAMQKLAPNEYKKPTEDWQ